MNTMSIRANDQNGDWTFGLGKGSYLTGEAAIEQNLATSLRCWLNDCFWQLNFGVDWANLIGSARASAQNAIILQCRQMIANSFGVTQIVSVSASRDALTRKLSLQYVINDIFTTNFYGTVTVSP